MKRAWLLLLCVCALHAEDLALWKEKLPGFRKPEATASLPERIFGVKVVVASGAIDASGDTRLKDAASKVASLTVTGLVWSDIPEDRRVLMGDIVMREGQAIPAYVFDDGRYYILQAIAQNKLQFKLEESDLSNPVVFEIPFGLKDPLKNQSGFSAGKDAKQQ